MAPDAMASSGTRPNDSRKGSESTIVERPKMSAISRSDLSSITAQGTDASSGYLRRSTALMAAGFARQLLGIAAICIVFSRG